MNRPSGSLQYDNIGRVVLISGGSSGIGAAICRAFVNSGAIVACMDIHPVSEPELASKVSFFQGDTSRERDCQEVVEQVVANFGGLDILVNNAAIQPPESYLALDSVDQALWQKMVDINFSGYTYLAKHSVKQMLLQQSGVIINIASGQGHRTARQVPCYGPIKAATLMQTMQWGVEYARQGIRVASVSPGAIRTPLVEASLAEQGGESELANRHPIGRIGEPSEVAAAVLWLSSSAASFVTGTDLQVDGGLGAFGAFADPYPMPDSPNKPA